VVLAEEIHKADEGDTQSRQRRDIKPTEETRPTHCRQMRDVRLAVEILDAFRKGDR